MENVTIQWRYIFVSRPLAELTDLRKWRLVFAYTEPKDSVTIQSSVKAVCIMTFSFFSGL